MHTTTRATLMGAALALLMSVGLAHANDELQWLEDPHGQKALDWARQGTQQTRTRLSAFPSHGAIAQQLRTVLAQAPAEPDQFLFGTRAVRLLRDAAHPYGLLQTAPRNAKGVAYAWSTVLDVAALRKREGIPFELQMFDFSSGCLEPDYVRCLLRLSPGGGDEVEIREFDLAKGEFVTDGFRVGKSRASAKWMSADEVLVGHTLHDSPTTLAGWPAAFRLWTRGKPLESAKIAFEGKSTDAIVQATTVGTGASTQAVVTRALNYSTFDVTLVDGEGRQRHVPLPQALKGFGLVGTTRRHVLVQLAQDATIAGKPYRAETVLAYDADASTPEGRRVSTVYAPVDGEVVDPMFGGVAAAGDAVYLTVNKNLRQRVVVARADPGSRWSVREVLVPQAGETVTLRADTQDSDSIVMAVAGFVTPRAQYILRSNGDRQLLAQDPAMINADPFLTEIGSAISKDGTSVDYFLLRPRKAASGPMPLLMTGYGAFGISLRPGYFDGLVGGPALKLWLERGGAVAIPAMRGGGERGEAWHQAAIRENRQNSYDDFIAVTEHLIKQGAATRGRIGIFGLSNGGLLTATLGTQRPDLFGAVVSDVPLTDLIRMRDMGMGAAWLNEYGDPDIPAQAKAMLAYSPYQNVRQGTKYPPFLVTISTEDNRVGPGHARKFAHRLMDAGATTFFYEDEEGGHGVSDAFRNPELMALRMTFLIDTLMPAHSE